MIDTIKKIKQVKTASLIPYINNARTHNEEQISLIAASIKEYGFNNPVLTDGNNGIIAGHGRLLAAQKLGLETVPCVELSHLSETEKRAYILADNKLAELSAWDDKLLKFELDALQELDVDVALLGFKDVDFPEEEQTGLTDPDDIPEFDETQEPITKAGDLWILGNHRLLCGDSTDFNDVEMLMNGEVADMVFTDPPYGVSYGDKNKFLNALDRGNRIQTEIENDHLTLKDTGELWRQTFQVWAKFHNDYSSYYICSPQSGELFLMMMMMMNENKHPLKHCLIWAKNNHVLGRSDYNYKHEPILYGWQHKHKFYGNGEQKFSVWNVNKPLKNDLHPTMKPIELIVNAILNSSEKDMLIVDYFLGSGSTLIACEKTGRRCYGMEISPKYCDVAVKRWEEFTGKKAVLI